MSSSNQKGSLFKQFADFLKTFGVFTLATAFVIGTATNTLVQAIVTDFISPLIGIFLPSGSLETLSFTINGFLGSTSTFKIGDIISQVINFIIIVFIIFLLTKEIMKFHLISEKKESS